MTKHFFSQRTWRPFLPSVNLEIGLLEVARSIVQGWIEYINLVCRWGDTERKRLFLAVVSANLLSYIGLGAYYAVELWLAVSR